MTLFQILSYRDQSVLYSGAYLSFQACVESAVAQDIVLDYADLKHRDLHNLNIDGARMEYADFEGSNLTGANLSEAFLRGSSFQNCELYNTCFVLSDLSHCDFEEAHFGATDITDSDISYSRFGTLSCFSLAFTSAKATHGCVFVAVDGSVSAMSFPPVVITGAFDMPTIFLDHDVRYGHELMARDQWIGALHPRFGRSKKA